MAETNDYFDKMFGSCERDKKYDKKVGKALERAHDIRKFEIDLYWRRGLYFWGFNFAIFTSFGLLLSKMAGQDVTSPFIVLSVLLPALALALLGLFISIIWYFVHKGSKAWQQNWEHHIDFLEESVTGNLHKITLGKRDDFYSVSRANEWVIRGIGGFWFIATTYLIALMTYPFVIKQSLEVITLIIVLALCVALVAFYICHPCLRTGDRTFGEEYDKNLAKDFHIYRRDKPRSPEN